MYIYIYVYKSLLYTYHALNKSPITNPMCLTNLLCIIYHTTYNRVDPLRSRLYLLIRPFFHPNTHWSKILSLRHISSLISLTFISYNNITLHFITLLLLMHPSSDLSDSLQYNTPPSSATNFPIEFNPTTTWHKITSIQQHVLHYFTIIERRYSIYLLYPTIPYNP